MQEPLESSFTYFVAVHFSELWEIFYKYIGFLNTKEVPFTGEKSAGTASKLCADDGLL